MIVAGIGCRKGAGAEEICAAIRDALAARSLPIGQLTAIATIDAKRDETGIQAAASALGLPLRFVTDGLAHEAAKVGLTNSSHSLAVTALPSASEAAALGAVGSDARLLGPRLVSGRVTCALAANGDYP